MNLENIISSKRSLSQKTTYFKIPFIQKVQKRKVYRYRKQTSDCMVLRQGWRRGTGLEEIRSDRVTANEWEIFEIKTF